MAFPATTAATTTNFATSVTAMSVSLPTSIAAGDLLLAFVEVRNSGTWTLPSGWTQLITQLGGGGSVGQGTVFYKIAAGTEGSSASWTASVSTTGTWHTRKITGWHGTTPPEATSTSGDSSSANPPSLTPSWGSDDTLWLAMAGHAAGSASAFTAAPSGYSDFTNSGASSGGSAVSLATCYKQTAATSEDPGTFTVANNRFWNAITIGVRPAAAGGGGGSGTNLTTMMMMGVG